MRRTPADLLAELATTHRWKVIVGFLLITIAAGFGVPGIQTDFTPSDLFAAFEDQKKVVEQFHDRYGNSDNVVMVLVVGENVLEQEALDYVQRLSVGFDQMSRIERVESITSTNMPRLGKSESADGKPDGGGEEETGGDDGESAEEPFTRSILKRMVSGEIRVDPVVDGETVDAEEARKLREALQNAPLMDGRLVSKDRTVAAVTLFLDRDLKANKKIESTVNRIRDWLEQRGPPAGFETRLAGLPYVRTVVVEKMRADQTVLLPAAIIVSLLILLAAFRWWPAAVFPLVAVSATTVLVVGGMAFAGEPFNIVNNIVPLLVIIIGISDAIHLINRYGEEYRESGDTTKAAKAAVRSMATACFLTSFTTAIGFASLGVANTEILQRFGITAAIGVLFVYLATILLIPALLPLVGPPKKIAVQAERGKLESWIEAFTSWVVDRPWRVVGGAALVALIPVYFATQIDVDNAVLDQLDPESQVYKTTKLIERKLYGVRPLEVSLRTDEKGRFFDPELLNRLDELQRWAKDQEGVIYTSSPTDFLHEIWYLATGELSKREAPFESRKVVESLRTVYQRARDDPLSQYLAEGATGARLSIQLQDMGAKSTIEFAEKLEEKAAALYGPYEDVEVRLTGDAYVASLGLDVVIRDLLWSLATAFVVIFSFLALVLGSGRLALLSIPSNTAPLVVTMGYMAFRAIPINAATAIIFSVSIGLAVDGTIHLLARFREEVEDYSARSALLRASRGTGKAIFLTYVALMLGFGVMLFSSFVPVRRFGELISVTVCVCLLATIIVLPTILLLGWRDES